MNKGVDKRAIPEYNIHILTDKRKDYERPI
jgi:hypothetical protein